MPKRSVNRNQDTVEVEINTLDVALLDLFAQNEAILRCGRQIQRSIVTLRGGDGALSTSKRASAISRIQSAATAIHEHCTEMLSRAGDVAQAADKVE
jgi:hypothetical protein